MEAIFFLLYTINFNEIVDHYMQKYMPYFNYAIKNTLQ